MQELAKIRAFDKLFFDTGVEEEDITQAFFDHRISQREEFKAIIENSKKLYEEKLQALLS